jgi:hypothetical protein
MKEGLAQLPESWVLLFKRMYSPADLNKDINDVVDLLPEDKLDWAFQQVCNSVDKVKSNEKS